MHHWRTRLLFASGKLGPRPRHPRRRPSLPYLSLILCHHTLSLILCIFHLPHHAATLLHHAVSTSVARGDRTAAAYVESPPPSAPPSTAPPRLRLHAASLVERTTAPPHAGAHAGRPLRVAARRAGHARRSGSPASVRRRALAAAGWISRRIRRRIRLVGDLLESSIRGPGQRLPARQAPTPSIWAPAPQKERGLHGASAVRLSSSVRNGNGAPPAWTDVFS